MILMMTGENNAALAMLKNDNAGLWLDLYTNPHQIDWGAIKIDFSFWEKKMLDNPLHRCIVKTWRYQHTPFPKCQVWGESEAGEDRLKASVGYNLSLDISTRQVQERQITHQINEILTQHKDQFLNTLEVSASARRSAGHQGRLDNLHAWDLPLTSCKDLEEACDVASDLCMELKRQLLPPLATTVC